MKWKLHNLHLKRCYHFQTEHIQRSFFIKTIDWWSVNRFNVLKIFTVTSFSIIIINILILHSDGASVGRTKTTKSDSGFFENGQKKINYHVKQIKKNYITIAAVAIKSDINWKQFLYVNVNFKPIFWQTFFLQPTMIAFDVIYFLPVLWKHK